MFMLTFFALYLYALANSVPLSNGLITIMVFYALISDLLLYSLVSQWVKRPNVSRPIIKHTFETGPFGKTDDPFERSNKL